jgi:fucose permease
MLFYLLSFIDKANLGNAMPAGLQTDLKITSWQYSVALTIFYPPYILTELPANLLIKRVGAHRGFPRCQLRSAT